MNNYLIRGGQLYDGSGDASSALDLRISDSCIQELGPGLDPDGAQVIDATGLIVAPGLIDIHSHVFSEMGVFSVDFAAAGLKTGVTTLLDTGSAGSLSYPVFHRFIISQSSEDIFALLNISQIGVCGHPDIDPVGRLPGRGSERTIRVRQGPLCPGDRIAPTGKRHLFHRDERSLPPDGGPSRRESGTRRGDRGIPPPCR